MESQSEKANVGYFKNKQISAVKRRIGKVLPEVNKGIGRSFLKT